MEDGVLPSSTPQRIDTPAVVEEELPPLTAKDFSAPPPDALIAQLAALVEEDRGTVEAAVSQSVELAKGAFKAGRYQEALEYYEQAAPGYGALGMIERQTAMIHNRALCYEHLSKPEAALTEARKVLGLDISYLKAYLRAGRAFFQLGNHREAQRYFVAGLERARSTSPKDMRSFEDGLEEVKARMEAEATQARHARLAAVDASKFSDVLSSVEAEERAEAEAKAQAGKNVVELTDAGAEVQKNQLQQVLQQQVAAAYEQLLAGHRAQLAAGKDEVDYLGKMEELKAEFMARSAEVNKMTKEELQPHAQAMFGGAGGQ
jgi:tetratricopeptide (TPR) repeat protein